MFKKSQDHLKEMNESYFVHMLAAVKISTMIIGGILALYMLYCLLFAKHQQARELKILTI